MQIDVTDRWHRLFPGSHVGVLLVGNVENAPRPTPLDQQKREIEARLRDMFAGYTRTDLLELDVLRAYRTYYKRFGKTYHVQLQLESVVHKRKPLPTVNPLVDAMFAAELETLILSAGHDADRLAAPLTIDATYGGEAFTTMNGAPQSLKPNDMLLADATGPVCTIIYGQDDRTPISPRTRRAMFVAYAPAGISRALVQQHLDTLWNNVLLASPDAAIEQIQIFAAAPADA